MNPETQQKFDTTKGMSIGQVAGLYEELFAERCQSRNRQFLVRRIAWKLQASTEGGLSKRACLRAKAIADAAPIRTTTIDSRFGADLNRGPTLPDSDRSVLKPGCLIEGEFQGQPFRVMVMDDGFEFESTRYVLLSDVAFQICGDRACAASFFEDRKSR